MRLKALPVPADHPRHAGRLPDHRRAFRMAVDARYELLSEDRYRGFVLFLFLFLNLGPPFFWGYTGAPAWTSLAEAK